MLGVTVAGSTVTVNLGGQAKHATAKQLGLFYAQLVWTLTAPARHPAYPVRRARDGKGQAMDAAVLALPGGIGNPVAFQTLAAYQCFDPYPSSPASFYYVDRGRCGPDAVRSRWALQGLIGPVVPVVGRHRRSPAAVRRRREPCYEGYYGLCRPLRPFASGPVHGGRVAGREVPGRRVRRQGRVYVGSLTGGVASFAAKPRLSTTGRHRAQLGWQ